MLLLRCHCFVLSIQYVLSPFCVECLVSSSYGQQMELTQRLRKWKQQENADEYRERNLFFCGPLFSVIFQFSFITPAIKHNFAVVVVGVVVHFFCAVRLLLFVFRFCCQSLFRLFGIRIRNNNKPGGGMLMMMNDVF